MASSSVIGLDIGSSQIKGVCLERRRNGWSLAGAGIVPTPPESVQDGLILDVPRVSEAVRQLFRDNRIPGAEAVAAVSGSHVLVRSIKVPDMNMATLKRSIRFEAAKHADQGSGGLSPESTAVEFEVLGRSGSPPQLDVLLVVAPQPMVDGRVNVAETAGLEPVAVDVEAFALLRAMRVAGLMPPEGEAAVVMNLGATYTDLNIVVGSEVAVTRSIPIGGNALTASVASLLNVSFQEAEERKRELDMSEPRGEAGAYDAIPVARDPGRQVSVPFVDELIRELRRSVIYFQSQAAEAGHSIAVDSLILTGGGTQLHGLPEYLRERLGMTVSILDPLALREAYGPVADHWRGHGPELAVALGLALKEYN